MYNTIFCPCSHRAVHCVPRTSAGSWYLLAASPVFTLLLLLALPPSSLSVWVWFVLDLIKVRSYSVCLSDLFRLSCPQVHLYCHKRQDFLLKDWRILHLCVCVCVCVASLVTHLVTGTKVVSVFTVVNDAAWTWECRHLLENDFISFGYIPKFGIAGSYYSSIFN